MKPKRIFIAVTGASGSLYAQRLLETLLEYPESQVSRIYLSATPTAVKVCDLELNQETGKNLSLYLRGDIPDMQKSRVRVFDVHDLFAPLASGSSTPTHMVVVPCSMGSLARIATSISSHLIERASDVMLKQKKPLILVPRETPLHMVHLEHMLTLSKMGAHIVPAMPAFYQKPKKINDLTDFMVGRILELCDLDHRLYKPWNERCL